MKHRVALCVLVFMLQLPLLKAQDPAYVRYTADNGLYSNEIYDVIQDSNGILYIANEEGLQYFDGYAFQSVDLSCIDDEGIVRLAQDRHKTIWAVSIAGDIVYIQDGVAIKHPMSDKFRNITNYIVYHFFVDENDQIWLNTDRNKQEYKVTTDSVYMFNYDDETQKYYYANFRKVGKNFSSIKNSYTTKYGGMIKCETNARISDTNIYITTYFDHDFCYRFVMIDELEDNKYVAIVGSRIIIFNKDSIIEEKTPYPEHHIINMYVDSKKNIWVSTFGKGVSVYSGGTLANPVHILSDISISNVYEDRENNYWLASLNSGLYQIESLHITKYTGKVNTAINDLWVNDKGLYAINNTTLFLMPRGETEFQTVGSIPSRDYFNRILEINGQIWLSGKSTYKMEENKPRRVDIYTTTSYDNNNKGTVAFLGSNRRVYLYDYKNDTYHFGKKYFARHLRDLCYRDDTLWVGAREGLYYQTHNLDTLTPFPLIENNINCIEHTSDYLLIGTKNKGLVIYNNNNVSIIDSSNSSLRSNQIEHIYVENDRTIWIITDISISKLQLDMQGNPELSEFLFQIVGQQYQYNTIKKFEGSYWVGTDKGILKVSSDYKPSHNTAPSIFLKSVSTNKTNYKDLSHIVLKHDQNDLTFSYLSVQFRNHDQLTYHFMVDRVDETFNITTNTSCTYYNLPPGKHTFRVKALNADGVFTEEAIVHFIIRKHWANTIAFRTLVFFIIVGIGYYVFNKWNRRRKRLFAQEQELTKAELKAFRSQMNPHFIFNSMNAIQNLVLLEKTEEAHEYLTRFSVLMRRTLNYSKKQRISLQDELSFLQTYVQIETLRFKQKFSYTFNIDPELDTSFIQIPPFLLQPLIENAVIHGLSPLENEGKLSITMKKDGDDLLIEIEDNGVGRKISSELNKIRKDHDSTGINNIHERINLLNLSEGTIYFDIEDLYNPMGQSIGTKAILRFPLEL